VGLALTATAGLADTPQRVVSMNLCTDQLALMLADEGQLISVSDIAQDPLTSAMHREAAAYPINYGGAEEIFLLQPDLVLAGVWSDPTTVAMLRSLGIEVAQIDVANSLADVPDPECGKSARLLGQEDQAEALIARSRRTSRGLPGPTMARAPRSTIPTATRWAPARSAMTSSLMQASSISPRSWAA
jgi:iron complex transport system substrate-binding protein